MKKTLVAIALASCITGVQAQVAETENIVITASRTEAQVFDALAAVEVITREDIDSIQPQSISDLLSRFAGITESTQGSRGHQSSLFVRGANSDHVLILVNGVRVGSATLGVKQLSTIPVSLIERVEVVKGPRAALWGSDAIAGVIQIFTRQQQSGEGQIGFSVGHDNYSSAHASVGLGNESHQYTLSAFVENSDGFDVITPDPNNPYAVNQPDDDGYDRQSVAIVGLSKFSDTFSLEVNGQVDSGNTEIDASFGGDENDHDNYHFLLRGHWQLSQANVQLGYAKSKDDNEDNADDLVQGASKSFFQTTRDQLNVLASFDIPELSSVTVGAEWYDEAVSSSTAFADTSRDAYAVFATTRQQVDQWHFEQALRYDDVGDTDSETTFNLSAGYQLSDSWFVALSHGTAFKVPTFNDLFWPDAFGSRGNPDLVSETSSNTELLTRYQQDGVEFEVSVYQNDIDDLIEWAQLDPNDPFSVWQPTNVSKVEIKGIDLSLSADLLGLNHAVYVSHIDARNKATDRQLARRPFLSANYQLSYRGEGYELGAVINHQGGRNDSGRDFSSYTLVDLTAQMELTSSLNVHARLTNIFDKEYMSAYQYQGDGQGFRIGLNYQF